MSLTLVTPPAVRPVTEAEFWAHLRVPLIGSPAEPVDKAVLRGILDAVISEYDGRDGILGRALMTQTWDLTRDEFPANDEDIRLWLPPVQSITSITYVDSNGVTQTLDSSVYSLSADTTNRPRARLRFQKTWPSTRDQPDAVTIRFVAGYASGNSPDDGEGVPAALRDAIKLRGQALYERDPRSEDVLNRAARTLIAPFRTGLVA